LLSAFYANFALLSIPEAGFFAKMAGAIDPGIWYLHLAIDLTV
jgi:hypothetical protein